MMKLITVGLALCEHFLELLVGESPILLCSFLHDDRVVEVAGGVVLDGHVDALHVDSSKDIR